MRSFVDGARGALPAFRAPRASHCLSVQLTALPVFGNERLSRDYFFTSSSDYRDDKADTRIWSVRDS